MTFDFTFLNVASIRRTFLRIGIHTPTNFFAISGLQVLTMNSKVRSLGKYLFLNSSCRSLFLVERICF